jgi:hypothetical protein
MALKSHLLIAGVVTLLALASVPVDAHHSSKSDGRIVAPLNIQVFAHVPVAAGYEPLPQPQHCRNEATSLTGIVYSEDFEGAHGYSFLGTSLSSGAPNLWKVTTHAGTASDAGHSAPNRLYFGNTATNNYDVGHSAGVAQSPSVALPSGTSYLMFNTKWQVEWLKGYDHLWVEARGPDGRIHVLCTANAYDRADPMGGFGNTIVPSCSPILFAPCPSSALMSWETRYIQIPSYLAGQTVNIRFTFDSADDKANPYMGWMGDDVRVGTGLV